MIEGIVLSILIPFVVVMFTYAATEMHIIATELKRFNDREEKK